MFNRLYAVRCLWAELTILSCTAVQHRVDEGKYFIAKEMYKLWRLQAEEKEERLLAEENEREAGLQAEEREREAGLQVEERLNIEEPKAHIEIEKISFAG